MIKEIEKLECSNGCPWDWESVIDNRMKINEIIDHLNRDWYGPDSILSEHDRAEDLKFECETCGVFPYQHWVNENMSDWYLSCPKCGWITPMVHKRFSTARLNSNKGKE